MRRLLLPIALILVACGGPAPQSAPPVKGDATLRDQSPSVAEADWPWWRGSSGDGIASGAEPPLRWGPESNVVWKVPMASGHASPVVCGGKVFVATADAEAGTQSLVCLDAGSGDVLWTREIAKGPLPRIHRDNSHASATPVCDGVRCYVVFASADEVALTAVHANGEIAWRKSVAPYNLNHGIGGSPLLYRSSIVVAVDGKSGGKLVAFDRDSGKQVWSTARPACDSYSAPRVATLAGRAQLVIHAGNATRSYDPETGSELWRCAGPSDTCANTPTLGTDRVYVSGGYPQKKLLCIKADGTGDVEKTHLVWTDKRDVGYVTSALLHDGRLFAITDKGVATCYDAATGEQRWREKLRERFSASPVLAGGRLYVGSESGKTFVIAPGDRYELLATNTLPGRLMATPAFCGKRVYLRTDSALYCIGN